MTYKLVRARSTALNVGRECCMFQDALVLAAADFLDEPIRRIIGYAILGAVTGSATLFQMFCNVGESGESKITPSPTAGYNSYHACANSL